MASLAQQFNGAARLHPDCGCFGARIDLLGRFPRQGRAIVEVKTSAKVQPTFRLQTAGQVIALGTDGDEVHLRDVKRVLLQLRADGSFDAKRDTHIYSDECDFATVWGAARVAHWRMQHDPKARKLAPHDHALYREDGTQVPGIGTVLGLAGLVDLRDIPPHILEAAAHKGSLVHTAIEYLVADDLDEEHLDPALKGYVESFKRFRDATGFQVEACEKSVIFDCSR